MDVKFSTFRWMKPRPGRQLINKHVALVKPEGGLEKDQFWSSSMFLVQFHQRLENEVLFEDSRC